jgi:hypothetical protein
VHNPVWMASVWYASGEGRLADLKAGGKSAAVAAGREGTDCCGGDQFADVRGKLRTKFAASFECQLGLRFLARCVVAPSDVQYSP